VWTGRSKRKKKRETLLQLIKLEQFRVSDIATSPLTTTIFTDTKLLRKAHDPGIKFQESDNSISNNFLSRSIHKELGRCNERHQIRVIRVQNSQRKSKVLKRASQLGFSCQRHDSASSWREAKSCRPTFARLFSVPHLEEVADTTESFPETPEP